MAPATLTPEEGWHCGHFFYAFDHDRLGRYSTADREQAIAEFLAVLSPGPDNAPRRLQTMILAGHRADFGLMVLDPDPLRIDAMHQGLNACRLGPAMRCVDSYVSLTEVSEYVPTLDQFRQRLLSEGMAADSPALAIKVRSYEEREVEMRRQRLWPDLPDWPAYCFYPMNKSRRGDDNWYRLPFETRAAMMSEHGRSGMAFAGKVTQLITVGIGLDDWEWGVTLWARNPQYLKEIVYRLRFDEASARYAEFGPFHSGFPATPEAILQHCRILSREIQVP